METCRSEFYVWFVWVLFRRITRVTETVKRLLIEFCAANTRTLHLQFKLQLLTPNSVTPCGMNGSSWCFPHPCRLSGDLNRCVWGFFVCFGVLIVCSLPSTHMCSADEAMQPEANVIFAAGSMFCCYGLEWPFGWPIGLSWHHQDTARLKIALLWAAPICYRPQTGWW